MSISPKKWTTRTIRSTKGKQKLVSLTAYDFTTARLVDEAGIAIVIVGDSLGMTMLGYDSTVPVTMEDMLHHTRAVVRGTRRALVVADMPFLSYQVSIDQAVDNAGRLIKEAGADAVKIEGGHIRSATVKTLVDNGIPVMGHLGLTPQSVKAFGGYVIQGKTKAGAKEIKEAALLLEKAGAFSIVLEGIPTYLAKEITESIEIPTIGIGAGRACDGQVLVVHDLLGLYDELSPKFVKRYADLKSVMTSAFKAFKEDIEQGVFPGDEHGYDP